MPQAPHGGTGTLVESKMHKPILHMSALLAALTVVPGLAVAQQPPAQQPAGQARMSQCGQEVAAFGRTMNEEGFWLSGYRRGYGWYAPGLAPGGLPPMAARTPPVAGTPPAAGAPAAGAGAPFGNVDWGTAPAQALRTLYAAAHVLDQNGSDQACRTVVAEARQMYAAYTAQLREAGVEPGELRSYRQRQLALARPVTERARGMRVNAITNTDVRNLQDEYLGSVEDIAFDPQTGEIAYVIIERGGFLGIGEDYVAVPWQQLRVTPALDTFVLDIPEDRMEAAPKVDRDVFATDEGYVRRRGEVDAFWSDARSR